MSWEFITIVRKVFQGDDHWGAYILELNKAAGKSYVIHTSYLGTYGETYKGKPTPELRETKKVKLDWGIMN